MDSCSLYAWKLLSLVFNVGFLWDTACKGELVWNRMPMSSSFRFIQETIPSFLEFGCKEKVSFLMVKVFCSIKDWKGNKLDPRELISTKDEETLDVQCLIPEIWWNVIIDSAVELLLERKESPLVNSQQEIHLEGHSSWFLTARHHPFGISFLLQYESVRHLFIGSLGVSRS